MGLERVAAVLQGVISNYETDLFTPLVKRAAELTGTSLKKELDKESHTKSAASLRVIADHSRAATFLISDGVLPSKERRGYVLRKIIRRAIRHGRLLRAFGARDLPGAPARRVSMNPDTFTHFSLPPQKPFLHEMVDTVVDMMKDAYPELVEARERISGVLYAEESRFARTLDEAMEKLEGFIENVREAASQEALDYISQILEENKRSVFQEIRRKGKVNIPEVLRELVGPTAADAIWHELRQRVASIHLSGDAAFQLYDTFGLPLDFIQDACRDAGIGFDESGFDRAMEEQKSRARASWKGAAKQTANPAYQQLPKSVFEGYWQTRSDGCEVLAIIKNGQGTQELKAGESGEVILDHTPFYADSGGQVGDKGRFYSDDHNTIVAEVTGCYAPIQGVRAHQVVAKSPIRVGDHVDAVVNAEVRESTMRNHTATHLLHAGLREVLGKHVKQAGSLVAPDHLRFDFSHFTAVQDEELQDIEDIINKEVLRNIKVETLTDVPIDEAINTYHAMALFGEKYGEKVRVVRIGDFSTELCGGTHTGATGEIGLIKILKEGSVSSGVRRVEAVTGTGSLAHFRKDHELEKVVSAVVSPTLAQRTPKDGAPAGEEMSASPAEALKLELEKKDAEIKRLARELDSARMKSASSSTANIGDKVKDVKGVKVLAHRVDNLERAQMRTLIDQLREKIGSGVVVLGSASNGNVALIVGVTKDLVNKIQAGKVIGPVAQKVGGKGGGRPDLAEAGGKDASALDSALDGAYKVVESLLA
jgi:alanyl-tRNA synthetase